MKVFYVPFNNRGLGVETYEEAGFMEDLVQQATLNHIEEKEDGIIFLYVSEPDSGFIKPFSQTQWPAWLKGINMVVRKQFSIEEGNQLAIALADGEKDNVVVFQPYAADMVTPDEAHKMYKKLTDEWGWGYVAPIEKVED